MRPSINWLTRLLDDASWLLDSAAISILPKPLQRSPRSVVLGDPSLTPEIDCRDRYLFSLGCSIKLSVPWTAGGLPLEWIKRWKEP